MSQGMRRATWQRLAVMGMAICLLALLVYPTTAGVAVLAAALILTPLFLFGLVGAPRSLWPAADLSLQSAPAAPFRAALWQRPPPSFLL